MPCRRYTQNPATATTNTATTSIHRRVIKRVTENLFPRTPFDQHRDDQEGWVGCLRRALGSTVITVRYGTGPLSTRHGCGPMGERRRASRKIGISVRRLRARSSAKGHCAHGDTEQKEGGADDPEQGGQEPYLPVLVDHGILWVVGVVAHTDVLANLAGGGEVLTQLVKRVVAPSGVANSTTAR